MMLEIPEEKLSPMFKRIKPDIDIEMSRDEAWNLSQQLSLILNSELNERNLKLAQEKTKRIYEIISEMKGMMQNENAENKTNSEV